MNQEAKLIVGEAICFDLDTFSKEYGETTDPGCVVDVKQGRPVKFLFCFEADRRIEAVRCAIGEAMRAGMAVKKIDQVISSTKKLGDDYVFYVNGHRIKKQLQVARYYFVTLDELPE
jgi:hypothetical protein